MLQKYTIKEKTIQRTSASKQEKTKKKTIICKRDWKTRSKSLKGLQME